MSGTQSSWCAGPNDEPRTCNVEGHVARGPSTSSFRRLRLSLPIARLVHISEPARSNVGCALPSDRSTRTSLPTYGRAATPGPSSISIRLTKTRLRRTRSGRTQSASHVKRQTGREKFKAIAPHRGPVSCSLMAWQGNADTIVDAHVRPLNKEGTDTPATD